jgi:hypothetical protein
LSSNSRTTKKKKKEEEKISKDLSSWHNAKSGNHMLQTFPQVAGIIDMYRHTWLVFEIDSC